MLIRPGTPIKNAVDSVFDWSKSLSLARTSMHAATPTANGNPLGLGGFETEKESALLDGFVNEKDQSNKKEDNGLEVRMGEASVVWTLDIYCAKVWTGRFRIGALK